MIYCEGTDLFRIETMGEKTVLELTKEQLLHRLRDSGVWSEDNINSIILPMRAGDATIKPHAVMV